MSAAALPPEARVLVVRMGALGDIVHALPVVAAIGAARPDVAVDWLVDARYAAVLALVEGVRTRVVVRASAAGRDAQEVRFTGASGMASAVRHLRRAGLCGGARPAGADQVGDLRPRLGRAPRRRLRHRAAARGPGGVGLHRDGSRPRRRTRRAEEPRGAAGAGPRSAVAGRSFRGARCRQR